MIIYQNPRITIMNLHCFKAKNQGASGLQQIPICNSDITFCTDTNGNWSCDHTGGGNPDNYRVLVGVTNSTCEDNFFEDLGCQVYIGGVNQSGHCYEEVGGPIDCYDHGGDCLDVRHSIYCSGVTPTCPDSGAIEVRVVCPDGNATCSFND